MNFQETHAPRTQSRYCTAIVLRYVMLCYYNLSPAEIYTTYHSSVSFTSESELLMETLGLRKLFMCLKIKDTVYGQPKS